MLNGTHTLVVGGTKGTGKVLVRMLVDEGQNVSVISRLIPDKSENPKIRYYKLDLLNPKGLKKVLADIRRNCKLNNLVFFQRFRGPGDDWAGELQVSLSATKKIIEFLIDEFADSTLKSIVIISSIAADFVAEEQPLSYHVAKAGLSQIARYYAYVLGKKGIRVNCVSPGLVLKEEARPFYESNKTLKRLYEKITPLGRMGTSEEIANVVLFLCSPKASYITGQNIIVDGGLSLPCQESIGRKLFSLDQLKIRQTNKKKSL
jgi:NAD(P)-dependent dehydrogenase (short-subunit alcohol dehydrogenase family)